MDGAIKGSDFRFNGSSESTGSRIFLSREVREALATLVFSCWIGRALSFALSERKRNSGTAHTQIAKNVDT